MCGIVGYAGSKQAQPVIIEALKKVQYRGYDSCGLAVAGDSIAVFRSVGTVDMMERAAPDLAGTVGIGHTRWATHGAVCEDNAHPHLDCAGNLAVVHNGVITNYLRLREELTSAGHIFRSHTDTEVIAHLLENHYHGNLREAMTETLRRLEGTWAIVAMHSGCPELVAARRNCPLIIGRGNGIGNFVTSDVLAFLDHTDRAVYLEEGDIATLTPAAVSIFNSQRDVDRAEHRINWTVEDSRRAGYEHFMIKEIHEQPRVIDQALASRVRAMDPGVNLGLESFTGLSNILFLACGSSYHAAMLGELLMTRLAQIPSRAVIASEFDLSHVPGAGTLVVGLSQSGETADTLMAVKKSRESGAMVLAVTNVPGSSITRCSHETLLTQAGPEIAVAATKTFTAQLMTLYLLALSCSRVDTHSPSRKHQLRSLSGKVESLLARSDDVVDHARYLANYRDVFVIARGWNYPAALEGALKLKEVACIHAEAFPAGELKHGPFALLNTNTPVIALVSSDETREAMLTSIKEIKARGAPVIALAPEGDKDLEQVVDAVIWTPPAEPAFAPLLNVTVLQLLSYHVARERNCPIDFPVNLAKSVTVQ